MRRLVVLLVITVITSACGNDPYACEWPGRPNCEPVGTTVVVEEPLGDGCIQRHFYDEIGEAAVGEGECSTP